MERREFTKWMTVGGAALAMGMSGTALPAVEKRSHGKVDRNHRKEWARDTWKGFENILMASWTGPDLTELDEAGIRHDVRKSIEHGFFSTLIESAALNDAELKRFIDIIADEAAGRIELSLTVTPRKEPEILPMLAYGEQAGVGSFLMSLPKQGAAEDLIGFGQRVARSTNMAAYIVLSTQHNFGRFHPSGVPFPVLDELVKEPNIVGAKIGVPEPNYYVEMFERYGKNFMPNCGYIPLFPLLVKQYGLQWSGGWTVEALQTPENRYAVEFFEKLRNGREDEAMKLYWAHVKPGFDRLMKRMIPLSAGGAHPWELMKYYQFAVGGNGGRYRVDPEHPEIKGVTAADMQGIRDDYRAIGIAPTPLADEAFALGRAQYRSGAPAPA